MTVTLRHGRIELALHEIRPGPGRALLLLHGLGEATPAAVPAVHEAWPGPVWGTPPERYRPDDVERRLAPLRDRLAGGA